MNTIGIVVVAALAASAETVPPAAAINETSTLNEIGCQLRQAIILAARPPVFDRDSLALDEPGFLQTLMESGDERCECIGRSAVEKSDYRQLLRARRERPRRCRADELRDELPPAIVLPPTREPVTSPPRRRIAKRALKTLTTKKESPFKSFVKITTVMKLLRTASCGKSRAPASRWRPRGSATTLVLSEGVARGARDARPAT